MALLTLGYTSLDRFYCFINSYTTLRDAREDMTAHGTYRESELDSHIREAIIDQPPSVKLVAKALELEGSLTQSELKVETLLARRTIRFALTRLNEQNVLDTTPSLVDARQKNYKLNPPDSS